ncbi:MAG: hypothetical protein PHW63_11675 [Alphaproteobacteria bacterium]|nr:hypothetical protein [Alphaproteobacteria bacterium]
MAMFDGINNAIRKKLQENLRYPVLFVDSEYTSDKDFFEKYLQNLTIARNNIDRRLGYVLTAIDVTAAQLGLDDDTYSEQENNAYRRLFLPMTLEQADIVLSIEASTNLEAFVLMFSNLITRDITVRPRRDATISIVDIDDFGKIRDVFIVPLEKLPRNPHLVNDAKRLVDAGAGDNISAKVRTQNEIHRLHSQIHADDTGDTAEVTGEEVVDETSATEPETENDSDNPYSASALHKMYERMGDQEVDDSSIDFIFAMMDKMTQEQKDRMTAALSSNWSSVMGPRVGSLLMSINSIAEDIPVSSKNYLDRVNEIFGTSISDEAKTHMVVQFHSALVQKII